MREQAGDHRLAPPDMSIAGIDRVGQVHGAGGYTIKHPLGQEKVAQGLGLGGTCHEQLVEIDAHFQGLVQQ